MIALVTDITWKYVDRREAAIKAMRDYSTMETILNNTENDLNRIAEDAPVPASPRLDGVPAAGLNPHASEERIVAHLERIDNRQRRYLQAREYMNWFVPAWRALTDDERWILETCFLTNDSEASSGSPIQRVCEHFLVERSSAYRRRSAALEHLATLLYGK